MRRRKAEKTPRLARETRTSLPSARLMRRRAAPFSRRIAEVATATSPRPRAIREPAEPRAPSTTLSHSRRRASVLRERDLPPHLALAHARVPVE
jgi:hypothetical protein